MRHQFRFVLFGIAALLVVSRGAGTSQGVRPTGTRPRLAVLVVVDQMRVDYLERYKDRFTDGFKRLRDGGAFFAEARYPYARTETSPGHATILTGRSPSLSGIEGNAWFDRQSGKTIKGRENEASDQLGRPGHPALLGVIRDYLRHDAGDLLAGRDVQKLVRAVGVGVRTEHASHEKCDLRKAVAQHLHEGNGPAGAHVVRCCAEVRL